jgi:hypothetical protein
MAEKAQKPKTSQKRKMKYCTFSAMPEEILAFKQVAGLDRRSLSWWIREILNREVSAKLGEVKQEVAS